VVVEEPAGGGVPEDFCAIWPQAKPVLRGIAAAASGLGWLFPPLAGAGPILLGLVAAGDVVYNSTCGAPAAERT